MALPALLAPITGAALVIGKEIAENLAEEATKEVVNLGKQVNKAALNRGSLAIATASTKAGKEAEGLFSSAVDKLNNLFF